MWTPKMRGKAALLTVALIAAGTAAQALTDPSGWSSPANLATMQGSGAGISTPAVDGCASLSPDGLSIAFTSNRTGNFDVYISRRANRVIGFGAPVRLPAPINTAADDSCPTLATNNRIYFSSNRDDPAADIYLAQPSGGSWTVTRLGPNINRNGWLDESATVYNTGDHEVMLYSSRLLDGTAGHIYQSVDGGPSTLVLGSPNSIGSNNRPSVTPDGRTIFFDSDRRGTLGGPDLYYATRLNPLGMFGQAVHLTGLSSPGFDARPFVSRDGTMLTFSSGRAGNPSPAPDIWFSTRARPTIRR